MTTQYVFHSDPAHGWLEAPMAEIEALGIADKITSYSYQSRDGMTVFLEEDGDLTTFAVAKGINDVMLKDWPNIRFVYCNHESPVRSMPSYRHKR